MNVRAVLMLPGSVEFCYKHDGVYHPDGEGGLTRNDFVGDADCLPMQGDTEFGLAKSFWVTKTALSSVCRKVKFGSSPL